MKLLNEIKRGKHKGVVQETYRTIDGKIIVSKTRFEQDYVFVESEEEAVKYLEKGYKLRMHSKSPKTSPSLITAKSIEIVN